MPYNERESLHHQLGKYNKRKYRETHDSDHLLSAYKNFPNGKFFPKRFSEIQEEIAAFSIRNYHFQGSTCGVSDSFCKSFGDVRVVRQKVGSLRLAKSYGMMAQCYAYKSRRDPFRAYLLKALDELGCGMPVSQIECLRSELQGAAVNYTNHVNHRKTKPKPYTSNVDRIKNFIEEIDLDTDEDPKMTLLINLTFEYVMSFVTESDSPSLRVAMARTDKLIELNCMSRRDCAAFLAFRAYFKQRERKLESAERCIQRAEQLCEDAPCPGVYAVKAYMAFTNGNRKRYTTTSSSL